MSEPRRKGSGFEDVRAYVLGRISVTGIAKITTGDIGEAVGISRQSAHDHLQTLLEIGVISSVRRSVYTAPNLTGTLREPDRNLTNGPPEPHFQPDNTAKNSPQPDENLTGTLQQPDRNLTTVPNDKNNNYENEDENEIPGGIFFWGGIGPGNGILRDGFPTTTDEIERFIDWTHPAVRDALAHVATIFTVKERNWSLELTRRIAFGVIYTLPGFDDVTLIERAKEADRDVHMHRLVEAALESNGNLVGKRNPHNKYRWIRIAKHVKMWLRKRDIAWTECRAGAEERIEQRGNAARERKRLGPTPEFPLLKQERQTILAAPPPSVSEPCKPLAPWLQKYREAWNSGQTLAGGKIVESTAKPPPEGEKRPQNTPCFVPET